jgi:transcriptional regulator with XRE-family HTH domain
MFGLSQAELAKRAGVAVSAVNELENGVTTDPRLSTLMAIAAALHVPAYFLITGESDPAMHRSCPDCKRARLKKAS